MLPEDVAPAVRRWWDSLVSEIPNALPPVKVSDWQAIQKREKRRHDRAGKPGDSAARAASLANATHTGMRDALRVSCRDVMVAAAVADGAESARWVRRDWLADTLVVMARGWEEYSHGTDDDALHHHADKLARWFDVKLSRFKVTGDADYLDAIRAEGDTLSDLHGVDRAKSNEKGNVVAIVARYACARWWRRRLRQGQRMAIEREKIEQGLVGEFRQVYCSDVQVMLRGAQLHRNREMLEVVQAINDEGQEYTLQELADVSVSNPKIRRSELMVRMRGFELFAKSRGHVALAMTLTCPSRMHPNDSDYDGTSAREAAAHLSAVWARIRSCLARYGVRQYGFRVAEPHKDGCPHWHAVLFFENDSAAEKFEFALLWYALGHWADGFGLDGCELGAIEHRCKVERITSNATGYLAKYISKGIDGWHEGETSDLFNGMGEGVGFCVVDHDVKTGKKTALGRSVDLAKRVQAWATCNRRRQFQQIGGPPVSLWREARRVDGQLADWEDDAAGPVNWDYQKITAEINAREEPKYSVLPGGAGERECLRAAADKSSWFGFCDTWARWHGLRALGTTPNVPRRWRLMRPVYWCADRVRGETVQAQTHTQYGDARNGQVCGFMLGEEFIGTRSRIWSVSSSVRAFERDVVDSLALAALHVDGRERDALATLRMGNPKRWRQAMRDIRAAAAVALGFDFAGSEASRTRRTVNNCTRPDPAKAAAEAIASLMRAAISEGHVIPAPS